MILIDVKTVICHILKNICSLKDEYIIVIICQINASLPHFCI